MQESPRSALVDLLLAALLAGLAAFAISYVDRLTQKQRAANLREHELAQLLTVLPAGDLELEPWLINGESPVIADGTNALPIEIYRAYSDDTLVALALVYTTDEGYVGPIRLLAGIYPDGQIIRLRAGTHRETPGLGDRIERSKSAWIDQFNGLRPTPTDAWRLSSAGGSVDAISGATVTSRAVLNSTHDALQWYMLNAAELTDASEYKTRK